MFLPGCCFFLLRLERTIMSGCWQETEDRGTDLTQTLPHGSGHDGANEALPAALVSFAAVPATGLLLQQRPRSLSNLARTLAARLASSATRDGPREAGCSVWA